MKKCLFRLYPFQELPLATGSFSGTVFSGLILFRMCLARLDPFQKLACQIFFEYSCLTFIFTLPKQIHRGSTRKTPFPSGFHVHSWTMAEL